jgi:type IV secretion system protein TrbL
MARKTNASFFRAVFWMILAAIVAASAPVWAVGGVLDSVQQTIQTASSGWMATSLAYAKNLFFGLAGLEFVWSAIQITLRKNDLPDIIVGTLFKVLSLAFFAMLLTLAPTWIPLIIQSFQQAGQGVSGTPPLTPSGIFDQGVQLASTLIQNGMQVNSSQNGGVAHTLMSGGSNLGSYFLAAIVIGLSGIMVILAFAVIALQMFVALVESYLVIGGGALMLGFLGSRWTTNFGEKYFAYAVSVGIKLFTLYLIVGFGNSVVQAIMNQLNALVASGQPVGFGDWLAIAGSALVYGGVGYMVPGIASSMMNGSPSMSLGNLGAASGMLAAAPVAAGLAAGAATTQAAGLVGKAFGRTQSGAAGGIGGSAASGGGFAGGISGGTAGLSRLTQAAGNVASIAGKGVQVAGQGVQAAGATVGAGIQAASAAAKAIPGVGQAIAAAGQTVGKGVEMAGTGAGKAAEVVGAVLQDGGDAIKAGADKAAQSPIGKDLSGAEFTRHGTELKGAEQARTAQLSAQSANSGAGGAASPSTVGSKPGGNGFTGAPGTAGGTNETGGMSASGGDANAAQRAFDADQKQGNGKNWSDKLLDKSSDLQHAADRKQPGLAHDGSGGSGISIRIQHHEH